MTTKLTAAECKLIEENHNLLYTFLQQSRLPIDDWYDVAIFGLIRAAQAYDPNRGAFSTIAFVSMKHAVWAEFRKQKAHMRTGLTLSLEQQICGDEDNELTIEETLSNENDKVENQAFLVDTSRLTDRESKIVSLFSAGKTQKEIGRELKISQAQVSRIKQRVKEKMFQGGEEE